LRILELNNEPITEILSETLGDGGKREFRTIEVLQGIVDYLPEEIDALVCTSDLQGMEVKKYSDENKDRRLLGIAIANELKELTDCGLLPPKEKFGVIFCGDFHFEEDFSSRGGFGEVDEVWLAFKNISKWVVGVAGNHDKFSLNENGEYSISEEKDIFLLDRKTQIIDGLNFSGISGLIGNSQKPWRTQEEQYLAALKSMLLKKPEVVLLHEPPKIGGMKGNQKIGDVIVKSSQSLVICGHSFWENPLLNLDNGSQVLNVNSRVVILLNKQ